MNLSEPSPKVHYFKNLISFISCPFLILLIDILIIYPLIPNEIINIIIIIALTTSPVFILTINVIAPVSFATFMSSKFAIFSALSISTLLNDEPKLFSLLIHFNVNFKSLLSPGSKYTSVSSAPSSLMFQYSGSPTSSYPSGILSNTFTLPAISPSFVTFILYFTTNSVLSTSPDFISTFAISLSDTFIGFPFKVMLSIVCFIEKSNTSFL